MKIQNKINFFFFSTIYFCVISNSEKICSFIQKFSKSFENLNIVVRNFVSLYVHIKTLIMLLLRNRNKKKNQENYVKYRSFVGFKLKSFPPIPPTSKIEEINVSDNNLVSFNGMVELQNLETLRCENTKITSFLGAKPLPSLKKLFINNTPLSHYSYHRVMAAIVFGDSLETVDFINITKPERLFAINNRELLFQYLIEGWVMTMADPIKIFNVNTRQRRILFPAPVFPSPKNSPVKSPSKSRHSTPVNSPQKQQQVYSPIQSKPIDINDSKTILLLMRKLHLILFEKTGIRSIYRRLDDDDDFLMDKDQKHNQNDDNVHSIEPLLINDEAYYVFVKMILMAVNTRSLHIKEVIQFFSLFKNEKTVSCMINQIPKFVFYSYPILADLLENLLEQNILTEEDVKPFFFSVYERFENWNSTFVLFESNNNLSVSFISFFCIFSNVINRVDNELFNNLQNQLGESEKEVYESFMKIHETRSSTIKTLLSDDIVSYASLTEANIIQNVIDYTPWSITTNVKSAAAAFSGSEYCFLQYSIKGENFNVLFKTEDQEITEEEDIQKQNLIDIKNEDEVLYFAVAGGNNNILLKFKHNDNDALIDYIPTAVQYHRFISLNQIYTRVTNSKYMRFDDDFFDLDDLIQEEEEQEDKNSSLSKFSRFYLPAAENLDYCALMFLARKKVPFDNSVLDIIISKGIPSHQSKIDEVHSNSFLVHFLLNIGFCTDDCLFQAVQKQNIEVAKVIINRFDSKKYDIITDETKIIRFRAQEKRNILKKIGNYKGDDNLHWTPLQVATCMNNLKLVELLALREEINVNEQDDEGNTSLTIAVSNNFIEIVKFLISLSNVNPNLADKKGWSPLSIAVGNNYVDIVSILISNLRTNVNCKTVDEGATPLMIAIDTNNFEAFQKLLTRNDINVNEISKNGKTAISIAIENERLKFINALIKTEKVDIKIGNAIQLANQSKNEEIKAALKKLI